MFIALPALYHLKKKIQDQVKILNHCNPALSIGNPRTQEKYVFSTYICLTLFYSFWMYNMLSLLRRPLRLRVACYKRSYV